MIKRIFFLLLFSLLIFGGLFALKFRQINDSINQMQLPPPPVVEITEVSQIERQPSISAIGSFSAVAGVAINSEVAGKVKAIHFQSGQAVKEGQLIVELDATTDESELKGLQAESRLAQIRFDRSEKMIKQHFIAQADYDQNAGLLDEARAAVETKKTLIAKKKIHAPFTGELGIRQVDLGQYLEPGSAIVTLQQLNPIYLDFSIPEQHLSQLAKDQTVTAEVQAYPGQLFTGRIEAISPAIDPGNRSVKIRAVFANADKKLHPGMFAQAAIVSEQKFPVLILPDTAITYNPYGNSVFLVLQNSNGLTVQSRQVETGQTRDGKVEIVKGLNLGDKVVSSGQVKLQNGMAIKVAQPSPGYAPESKP